MAVFPTLEPTKRSYSTGIHTVSTYEDLICPGSSEPVGFAVDLFYPSLEESEWLLVWNFYNTHLLTLEFDTPVQMWRLHDDQYEIVPLQHRYRFDGPPTRTRIGPNHYDVSVSLITSLNE